MNVPPLNVPPQALPPWLQGALTDMRRRYPNDALDIVAYPQLNPSTGGVVTVFRLVCGDCPGKLYIPGPGDTLSNFEIHLKNRNHRGRVQLRSRPRRSLL